MGWRSSELGVWTVPILNNAKILQALNEIQMITAAIDIPDHRMQIFTFTLLDVKSTWKLAALSSPQPNEVISFPDVSWSSEWG